MSEDEIRKEFETWFEHKMSLAPLSMNNSLRMCARELMLESYLACRNAALEAAAKVCADIAQKHLQSGSYVSVVADRAVRAGGQVDGAEECEKAIRALKPAPESKDE